MKNQLAQALRRTANRLSGDRQYSGSIAMTPRTEDGDFGARVIVEYDDPANAVRALGILGKPRWLVPMADELGVEVPGLVRIADAYEENQ